MKLLHLARDVPHPDLWTPPFRAVLAALGELEIVSDAGALPRAEITARLREADVAVTGWGGVELPAELAADAGCLRYVCHVTGTLKTQVPREVVAALPVTNWGDALAFDIAEAALTLLLACLKDLRPHIEEKRAGGWSLPLASMGSLRGLRLGLYGYGAIGRKFAELCQPFGAEIFVFDPFATALPAGLIRVASLDELFARSQAVALHAALTPATRGSVTAAHLARLPDHGIIVNTARGGLIDQAALFAELATGRLRAALDVLDGADDALPAGHPARDWPNLILTAHQTQYTPWTDRRHERLLPMHEICVENLKRFAAGEPLRFRMTPERYDLST